MNNPGTYYKASGKVDPIRYPICILVSMALCGLVGVGYGTLSHINPLIYLNILLLIGAVALTAVIVGLMINLSHSRSKVMNFVLGILSGTFLVYCAWVGVMAMEKSSLSVWGGFTFSAGFDDIMRFADHQFMSIGRFGRSGIPLGPGIMKVFYIIEAGVIVLIPIIFLARENFYYCEETNTSMSAGFLSYQENESFEFVESTNGNYTSLSSQTPIIGDSDKLKNYPIGSKFAKVSFYSCEKCPDAIIEVEKVHIAADDKGKPEVKVDNRLIKGQYVDLQTAKYFKELLPELAKFQNANL